MLKNAPLVVRRIVGLQCMSKRTLLSMTLLIYVAYCTSSLNLQVSKQDNVQYIGLIALSVVIFSASSTSLFIFKFRKQVDTCSMFPKFQIITFIGIDIHCNRSLKYKMYSITYSKLKGAKQFRVIYVCLQCFLRLYLIIFPTFSHRAYAVNFKCILFI